MPKGTGASAPNGYATDIIVMWLSARRDLDRSAAAENRQRYVAGERAEEGPKEGGRVSRLIQQERLQGGAVSTAGGARAVAEPLRNVGHSEKVEEVVEGSGDAPSAP
jgi:hypothetical protein